MIATLVLAHVGGVPVEEVLLPLTYVGGAAWLTARAVTSRLARNRGKKDAAP